MDEKKTIFSTNINDYVAFGEIKAKVFCQDGEIIDFKFHIPIVKENDGYYYSLCTELNDVSYSSDIKRSFQRIKHKIQAFFLFALEEKNLKGLFSDEENMKPYRKIFDELKRNYQYRKKTNSKKAESIDSLLKDESNVEYEPYTEEGAKPKICKTKSPIKNIKYEETLVSPLKVA